MASVRQGKINGWQGCQMRRAERALQQRQARIADALGVDADVGLDERAHSGRCMAATPVQAAARSDGPTERVWIGLGV